MAKVQYAYIKRKQAETGQTGNVTYDLPQKGFIPEIVVRVFSTPTASSRPALPINDAITKLEIVDGSTIIKSLSGNQTHGLEMIHRKPVRASTEKNDNAVEGYDDFILVLDGVVNGVHYCPDFARFANPQLKITWDYSLTTSDKGMGVDADTSPSMKFTVMAKVVREGGRYTHGYVKSNEIYTWTSATSTTTQTEIPRGDMLLGLMIDAGYSSKDWTEDIERVKLDFDNGAWIPFDFYEEEIAKVQEEWFQDPFELSFEADLKNNEILDTHMGYVTSIGMTPLEVGSADALTFIYPSAEQGIGTVKISSGTTTLAQYSLFKINVAGFMPYQCWYVPMSKVLNGDGDLIDTKAYSRIILETVSGSSAHTSSKPSVIGEFLITR